MRPSRALHQVKSLLSANQLLMPQVVDELVTRYSLDAKGYKKGAEDVKDSTASTAAALKKLKSVAGDLGGAFGSVSDAAKSFNSQVLGIGKTAGLVALAGVGGLVALATYAVNAAVEMDTLERRLLGVTGNAQKAARLMSMTKKLAADSVFETPQVAEATIKLEALGLSSERFTGIAVNLAQAMGGSNEVLQEFVMLLGRAKGGDLGQVFGPDGLGRFGMGRDFFKSIGAKFSKTGEFVGTIDEALNLIEKAVSEKFGAMSQNLASGPMAQIASFMDGLKFAAADVGKAILDKLLPVLVRMNELFSGWLKDGVFARIGAGLMAMFNIDMKDGPLGKGMEWLDSFIRALPERLVGFYNTAVDVFNKLAKVVRTVAMFMILAFAVQAVGAIINFISFLSKLGKVIKELIPVLRTLVTLETIAAIVATAGEAAIPIIIGLAAVTAAIAGGIWALNKILPQAPELGHMDVPTLPPLTSPMGDAPAAEKMGENPVQQALNNISANTAATAANTQKQLDMQRYVLGGGDLGRLGVTPVELRGGRGHEVRVKVDGAADTLDEYFSRLATKILREAKRRGAL